MSLGIIPCRLLSRARRSLSFLWRRQLYSCPPRLRQPNCDRLLRGTSSVLTFPDMFDLLVNEFSGLSGRRFALTRVLFSSFYGFFFRHKPPLCGLALFRLIF